LTLQGFVATPSAPETQNTIETPPILDPQLSQTTENDTHLANTPLTTYLNLDNHMYLSNAPFISTLRMHHGEMLSNISKLTTTFESSPRILVL